MSHELSITTPLPKGKIGTSPQHLCHKLYRLCIYESQYIYIYTCESRTEYSTSLLTLFHGTIGTGWRRLIGSPKLQIIFHKRTTKYMSLLRKMIYTDKGSYESSPLCIYLLLCICICICSQDLSLLIQHTLYLLIYM